MMDRAQIKYGLPTAAEIAGRTGREILQAIIDGGLPQPPIAETLSFLADRSRGRLRGV